MSEYNHHGSEEKTYRGNDRKESADDAVDLPPFFCTERLRDHYLTCGSNSETDHSGKVKYKAALRNGAKTGSADVMSDNDHIDCAVKHLQGI